MAAPPPTTTNADEDIRWNHCITSMRSSQSQFDEYWRLPTYPGISRDRLKAQAKRAGYLVEDKTAKATLVKMLHRVEKGVVVL